VTSMAKVDRTCDRCTMPSTTWSDPRAPSALIANGTIEVAPLAFMRGRTLNDSFIILDEAQNTTPEQMKMFLTRHRLQLQGRLTGVTQVDLTDATAGSRRSRRSSGTSRGSASSTSARRTSCDTASSPTSSPPTTNRRHEPRYLRCRRAARRENRPRSLGRARHGALSDEACVRLAEVSLIFLDEPAIAGAESAVHGQRRFDRRPEFSDRQRARTSGRVPDAGGSGPGEPPLPEIPPTRR